MGILGCGFGAFMMARLVIGLPRVWWFWRPGKVKSDNKGFGLQIFDFAARVCVRCATFELLV